MAESRPLEILSLGAGVQSTAILLMSCHGDLPKLDCAVFADTGWEPAAVYKHLNWLEGYAVNHGVPVVRVSAGDLREGAMGSNKEKRIGRHVSLPFWVAPDGALVRRQCTSEYKIKPIEKYIRRTLLGLAFRQRAKPSSVRQWLGISIDEIQRMSTSRNKWQELWFPLIEHRISRNGCHTWMEEHGFPEPPRSSCIGCPFHDDKEWLRLTPEEFEDACQFDEVMRKQRGMHGEAFLHRSLKPLREVDLRSKDEKSGQASLWQDECCGVCNT